MVGQEILVLFIMVRIRAPQPKIKTPLWRFYFWFVATVRGPQRTLPVRKQVDLTSTRAVKSLRFPRSRRIAPCEGIRAPRQRIFKSRFYENFLFWCIFAIFIV